LYKFDQTKQYKFVVNSFHRELSIPLPEDNLLDLEILFCGERKAISTFPKSGKCRIPIPTEFQPITTEKNSQNMLFKQLISRRDWSGRGVGDEDGVVEGRSMIWPDRPMIDFNHPTQCHHKKMNMTIPSIFLAIVFHLHMGKSGSTRTTIYNNGTI